MQIAPSRALAAPRPVLAVSCHRYGLRQWFPAAAARFYCWFRRVSLVFLKTCDKLKTDTNLKHPVPWCSYAEGDYPPPATASQLINAANRLKAWTEEHRAFCPTGHLLTFAWNEFEEGAWICPTIGQTPDAPDTQYRDIFAQLVKTWKCL